MMVRKNHSFDFEIIQVLGTVTIEESHNFNCKTFFSYWVTVFQLLLKLQFLQTCKLQLHITGSDFSVICPFQLQLLLTGFTLLVSHVTHVCVITNDSRHFIITNNGIIQAGNKPFTFSVSLQ